MRLGKVASYYKSRFTLPRPGSMASRKDIANLAQDLLHKPTERLRCMELLATYIIDAHLAAPASWWIHASNNDISLIAGHQKLVSIGPGGVGVMIDNDSLDDEDISDLQKYMAPKFWKYDDELGSIDIWIFAVQVNNFVEPVRRSSKDLLTRLASDGDLPECEGIMHSTGVIEYLNQTLDMDIPNLASLGRLSSGSRLQAAFAHRGFSYSRLQMATFYTALQTKGFVIFSGISGTGKTKLIQQFAAMLPDTSDDASNHLFLSVRPDWRDS